MTKERERAVIWSISQYEYFGEDIDTRTSYALENFKFYKNREDAYRFILENAFRAYIRFTSTDRIRSVGRPVVKFKGGQYRKQKFMQFIVEVKYEGFDETEYTRMIYEANTEPVF